MAFITPRTTRDGTSWRVQWRHGGRQHVRTFATQKHAEQWAARLDVLGHDDALALLDQPAPPPDMPTVAEAVASHVEHLTGVTDGTRRRYEQLARLHILPTLGDLPLDLLTYDRGAAWVNALERSGRASKTIRNVHSLLSGAMTSAVRSGHIPENVVKGLRMPRDVTEEMCFLEPAEMDRFVSLTPDYWQPLVALLFTTGLRFGEATALAVRDVNLSRSEILVRQAWKATSGAGYQLGPPKSPRARRTIPAPVSVLDDLGRLLHKRGADEFVFTNTRGGPVRHAAFHGHVWTPVVHDFAGDTRHETGLVGRRRWRWDEDGPGKRPRIHDARHSFASAAIAQGYSLTALQRHMGHETITTTSDTYGHLMRADRDAFASVVVLTPRGRALEA